MTDDLCPREAEVLRAGESGEWTPDLQRAPGDVRRVS